MQPTSVTNVIDATNESSEADALWFSKRAPASEGIHELIRKRFSPRAYKPESLDESQIQLLLEAAAWSSSSANEQPWRYAVALRSDTEAFQQMLNCLLPGNQEWAQRAGALLLCVAYTRHDAFNADNPYAWHDCGAANTTMLLQAASMGIGGRMMAGFDHEKTIAFLNPSPNFEPVCFIALGYPDVPESLPLAVQDKEKMQRVRKAVSQIRLRLP
jgi:nitroreductase